MSDQPMAPASGTESVDSWCVPPGSPLTREKAHAGHALWVVELEQRPEFQILEALLRNPDATPNGAVEQLLELTRKSALEEPVGNHCWMTACCFLEMVARTAPDHQPKLIAFLHLLRSITLSDPKTNEPLELDDNEGVVWRDLPTFGYTIADEMGSFGKNFPKKQQPVKAMLTQPRWPRNRLHPRRGATMGEPNSFLRSN
jgi:hypothetical protein